MKRRRDTIVDGARVTSLKRARGDLPCAKAREAFEALDSLGLSEELLDPDNDRCYCGACAGAARLPSTMTSGGNLYELPLGFCGFGIKVPPRAAALDIFSDWHVSYHGLKSANLKSVLLEGGLLLPGDDKLDGNRIAASHTVGGGEARRQLYTSPSVCYAELDVYTEPDARATGGWTSKVKIVLQCRQQPSYEVRGETVGWERDKPGVAISKHFKNSEIERITRARGSIIPCKYYKMSRNPRRLPSVISRPLSDRLLVITDRILVKVEEQTLVRWSNRELGDCRTGRDMFRKCKTEEFFSVGDVVASTGELSYSGHVVPTGGMGVLQEIHNRGGTLLVKWNVFNDLPALHRTRVPKGQVRKWCVVPFP